MDEIEASDLMEWKDDETRDIAAEPVAAILNKLRARIERLERESGRCQCMNCVVIGGR